MHKGCFPKASGLRLSRSKTSHILKSGALLEHAPLSLSNTYLLNAHLPDLSSP